MLHLNPALHSVDKFNYLKIQLRGEAKDVISGLDITRSNYDVAVKMLTERYGKKYLMIDAHYSQLRDIQPSTGPFKQITINVGFNGETFTFLGVIR